jgi:hypothetical protein
MPIRMYIDGLGTFDPETIEQMSTVFKSVCAALDLKPIDEAVTRLVAEKIIELAGSGVRSSDAFT